MARTFASASFQYLSATISALSGASAGTVAGWAKRTGSANRIAFGFDDASNKFLAQAWTDGKTYFNWYGTSPSATDSSTTAWRHLLIDFDAGRASGSRARLVTNGSVSLSTGTQTTLPTMSTFYVGRASTSYSDGSAAEIGMWSVVLTDDEITALAAGYSPLMVRPQSLLACWQLDGRNGTGDAIDVVGGYTLTQSSSPTVSDSPRIIYPRRRILVPAAAAVGGGFSAFWTPKRSGVIGAGMR